MFGRPRATVLLLLACQLASGCCCCYRPFLCCRRPFVGGCEPCTACYGPPAAVPAPVGAPLPPPAGFPVYNAVPVQSAPAGTMPALTSPGNNPPAMDRIPPFSSAALTSGGHR